MLETVLQGFSQGFLELFGFSNVLFLSVGVLLGIILGVTPGLGALIGISLVLPVIWFMEAGAGILMLIGIHAAVMTAGVVPTILMRIPGAPTNIATLADGYPMAERGEGARALGAALCSSALGGIVSVVLALLMVPLIVPLVLALGSPELTLLMLLGLSFLAALGTGEARIKNMIAGMAGILVSLIGIQDSTGLYRYTFGSAYLYDGVSLLLIALGVFAMAEIIDLSLQGRSTIASATDTAKVKMRDIFEGMKDVFRHWGLWFRSSVLGYIVGVIPGIGGTISIFMAYGWGMKTSKHPEKWGKGCVEGVIAPEAANNSSVGGSVLTTLAFGVPGDSVMALIMGAFLIFGVTPGKELLTVNLNLAAMIIIGVALANLLAVLFILPAVSTLTKTTKIHYKYLFCILLVLITASAFTESRNMTDIFVIIPLGIIGVCMKRFGYSLACFILGFILGGLFEHYLWMSLRIFGPFFFLSSPICIAFVLLLTGLFVLPPLKNALRRKAKR